MIESVEIREPVGLDDYADVVHLTEPVRALREEASGLVATAAADARCGW